MHKNNFIRFFLLQLFIFLFSANFCSAFTYAPEIPVSWWPKIPFSSVVITLDSRLPDYVVYFFSLGIFIGGVLAAISLAISGIQLILSVESPEKKSSAKKTILTTITGLIILISAFILISTINPQLKNVKTAPLDPTPGLQLINDDGTSSPATPNLSDISIIRKQGYNAISWPATLTDTAGSSIQNCDPSLNEIYVIYLFKDTTFKNFDHLTRLKCGDSQQTIASFGSYTTEKEKPGVYFYQESDCTLPAGKDSYYLPTFSNQSIPNWQGKDREAVKSMRIVNGRDEFTGPFYGVIYFNDPNYITDGKIWGDFLHFKFKTELTPSENMDNYSRCISNITVAAAGAGTNKVFSFIIYKWAGYTLLDSIKTKASGTGVTLYSNVGWTGGFYLANDKSLINSVPIDVDGIWSLKLDQVPIDYSTSTARTNCATKFNPANKCLRSFKIEGSFLVIVSENPDTIGSLVHGRAQAFPISSNLTPKQTTSTYPNNVYTIQMGTPELSAEWITNSKPAAQYMEIIPLAEPF